MALVRKNFTDLLTITRASVKNVYQPVDDGFGNISYPLVEVAANERALAWNPITGAPLGISIEEARTNLQAYSKDFTQTTWIKDAGIVPSSPTFSDPFGNSEATLVSVTNSDRLYANNTAPATDDYDRSFFVKAGTFAHLRVNGVDFDLLNGVVVNGVGDIEPLLDGWYRVSTNSNIASGGIVRPQINAYPDATFTAHTTSGDYYVFGAQVEQGSFTTSYIGTGASTATRAADDVTINSLVPWFNPSEGTFVVEFELSALGASSGLITINDATDANGIRIGVSSSNILYVSSRVGGATTATGLETPTVTQQRNKLAFRFTESGIRYSLNSGAVGELSAVVASDLFTKLQVGFQAGLLHYLNGTTAVTKYYPKALTDAQLQAESAI